MLYSNVFIMLVLIILFLLVIFIAFIKKSRYVIQGSLVSNLESSKFLVGNFTFTWDQKTQQLSIAHQSNPKGTVWYTSPQKGFVIAAKGNEIVQENRGLFRIKDHISKLFDEQTLETIECNTNQVEIRGKIRNRRDISVAYDYSLIFNVVAKNKIKFIVSVENNNINRILITYASEPDEQFFGFGEQFTYFNVKGKILPIFVMEQGIGRGLQPLTWIVNLIAGAGGSWHTSYASVPHYITTKMRSLALSNYEYNIFDLRNPRLVKIKVFSNKVSGYIFYGETPPKLIKEYTDITGRMRPLSDWVSKGAIVGLQGGTEKVKEIYSRLQDYDVPIAALWLQDWVGQRITSFGKQLWWNWELDEDRYPHWDNLIAELATEDIKILSYTSPFLTDTHEKKNTRRNLFSEAERKGYLVKNERGETYLIRNSDFSAGLIDLTNPTAWDWYKAVIKEQVLNKGVNGWMADFAEALPYDANLFSGMPAANIHNKYPELWAQLNREVLEESARYKELLTFHRSGYSNSPKYATLFWLGDQMVTWDYFDGLKTAVTGLLSSGLSGYSLNHSDIGGYTGFTTPIINYHRSQELLIRWMELNAFTVVFRSHEGNLPDNFVQVYQNDETLQFFSRAAKIYVAWEFYRKELIAEAASDGLPVVRHLFIHYPEDLQVYKFSYQEFLVGAELLIAPVLDPKTDNVNVYLPSGKWVHLWTQDIFGDERNGINLKVYAPLGKPAVFYKYGSDVGEKFAHNLRTEGLL